MSERVFIGFEKLEFYRVSDLGFKGFHIWGYRVREFGLT